MINYSLEENYCFNHDLNSLLSQQALLPSHFWKVLAPSTFIKRFECSFTFQSWLKLKAQKIIASQGVDLLLLSCAHLHLSLTQPIFVHFYFWRLLPPSALIEQQDCDFAFHSLINQKDWQSTLSEVQRWDWQQSFHFSSQLAASLLPLVSWVFHRTGWQMWDCSNFFISAAS